MTGPTGHEEKVGKAGLKGLSPPWWALFVAALAALACIAPALLLTWVDGAGHHLVGLGIALVLLVIPIGSMSTAIDELRIVEAEVDAPVPFHTLWFLTATSLVAVFVLLCVFAQLSLALSSWHVGSFLPVERRATYPDMLATYAWFLIDLVPFTDPGHAFGMKEPRLQPQGWIAGGQILAFEVIVVLYVLEILRRAWVNYQRQTTRQFLERLGITRPHGEHSTR